MNIVRQMKKNILNILVIVAAIMLISIVFMQFYNHFYVNIDTETAVYTSVKNGFEAEAYIVRDEKIVYSAKEGTFSYPHTDSTKVSAGQAVAYVFDNDEDAMRYREIKSLENEINQLSLLTGEESVSGTDPQMLTKQVNEKVKKLLNCADEGYVELDSIRTDILYLLTKYNLAVGKESSISEKIDELTAYKNQLSASMRSAPSVIGADSSGYFVSTVDGYENILKNYEVINMTPSEFKSKLSEKEAVDNSSVGKLIDSCDWYIVCIVNEDKIRELREGDSVKAVFPYCSSQEIAVTVTSINESENSDEFLVVFRCNYMSEDYASIRNQPVEIITSSYSGIKVSPEAIRVVERVIELDESNGEYGLMKTDSNGSKRFVKMRQGEEEEKELESYINAYQVVEQLDEKGNRKFVEKNVKVVFVKVGQQIRQRQVNILYEDDERGVVICEMVSGGDPYYSMYLKLYDEVVVQGRNMYDGRIIE